MGNDLETGIMGYRAQGFSRLGVLYHLGGPVIGLDYNTLGSLLSSPCLEQVPY